MDTRTTLRRRVGDTPLVSAPNLANHVGLPNLQLKLEGANPTGTQKDRIARLEVGLAVSRGHDRVSVASCGNFGVAVAHACYAYEVECDIFVPEGFTGERIDVMQEMGATVHRVAGQYEDAVQASHEHARGSGAFDANPGGPNTLRTLAGYSRIAQEIVSQLGQTPAAIGAPIGNGSTLAGVHLGFHTQWAQGHAKVVPMVFGGSSRDNNPVPVAMARRLERVMPLDPRSIVETAVSEPLVNWDALDGTACLTAIQDSQGDAYGFTDDELLDLHAALLKDGIDAHPGSLAAVAALQTAAKEGKIPSDATVVAVMTSGRPQVEVVEITAPEDMPTFIERLKEDLGRFGDPVNEMNEAIMTAFEKGHVLRAQDEQGELGHAVLTPMELDEFFPRFHLSYIAVRERARGRGVGTMLLEAAIRATNGDLSLHVETDNEAAIRLYEKFGFEKKYYRMLYKGHRLAGVPSAQGSTWLTHE